MKLQVAVGIEAHVVVKTFLVIAVAALHFPIMPWGSGTDFLMGNVQLSTQDVQRMYPVGFCDVGKFTAVIRLKDLWLVAKVFDGSLYEIHGGVTALFHVREKEAFPGGFINHGVLIELLGNLPGIAGGGDVFDIHLPFDPDVSRGIIGFWLVLFVLCVCFGSKAQPYKYPVEGAGVPGIAFFGAEFAVKLTDRDVRVSAVVILNPFQFLLCMSLGVFCKGAVGLINEGVPGTVKALVPA